MSEWQPIETAPKDIDKELLLYRPIAKNIQMGWWDDCYGRWCFGEDDCWPHGEDQPTHWMPLPTPPDHAA